MRLFAVLLALAALAVTASPASADYTLTNNLTTVMVGSGAETSVAVSYSAFCFHVCPADEVVGSTDSVAFADSSAICTDASGGDNTSFNCTKRPNLQVAGTAGADSVAGFCIGFNIALTFNGLGGDDTVSAGTCTGAQINMGDGNDTATAGGNVSGGTGNDIVRGGAGADTLDGGDGRDTVDGGAGNDTVSGGAGRDLLIPGTGKDVVNGGADADTGSYEDRDAAHPVTISLDDQANDGETNEQDRIAADVENVIGGDGGDTITGDANANDIDGGDGGDVIDPGGGADFVDGGAGNDRITARDGAVDRIQCGAGNDQAVVDAFDTVLNCEDVQASRALMPDVDADGVPAPADCADTDAARRPGFIDKPGNGVDEDCSGADAPYTRILSPVQFAITTRDSRTVFSRLRVQAVPEGATIELRCTGGTSRGCFKGVQRFRSPKGDELRDIRKPIRGRRLRSGARLEVRILDADSIGKVFRFTMRSGKRTPTTQSLCLVPGQNAPGRCPKT